MYILRIQYTLYMNGREWTAVQQSAGITQQLYYRWMKKENQMRKKGFTKRERRNYMEELDSKTRLLMNRLWRRSRTTIYLCFDTEIAKRRRIAAYLDLQVLKRIHKSWPPISMKSYYCSKTTVLTYVGKKCFAEKCQVARHLPSFSEVIVSKTPPKIQDYIA